MSIIKQVATIEIDIDIYLWLQWQLQSNEVTKNAIVFKYLCSLLFNTHMFARVSIAQQYTKTHQCKLLHIIIFGFIDLSLLLAAVFSFLHN